MDNQVLIAGELTYHLPFLHLQNANSGGLRIHRGQLDLTLSQAEDGKLHGTDIAIRGQGTASVNSTTTIAFGFALTQGTLKRVPGQDPELNAVWSARIAANSFGFDIPGRRDSDHEERRWFPVKLKVNLVHDVVTPEAKLHLVGSRIETKMALD